MAPRTSAPLRCVNCGWKTKRRLENAGKGCSKCGGHLAWDSQSPEEDRALAWMVVAAVAFMAVMGIILESLK
jgi:predicted  nucleic acid-binding Zn-ribbon protein